MLMLSYKTVLFGAAGAFGGAAAWMFILAAAALAQEGLLTEIMLGALAGMFIGGFIWSQEAIEGGQIAAAFKRAAYGAVSGLVGGAAGAGLGNAIFTMLGTISAESAGIRASLGMAVSVSLGWSVLGAIVGLSGGLMIRSRERAIYGLAGGALGGLVGGAIFNALSATSIWSVLAGLTLLGMSIGSFISFVEVAFLSATLTVIKGRHINREFPLLKDVNVVGRDDRSDVCLSGAEGVTMQHAVIKRTNGRYLIETGEQAKGVYVNQTLSRSAVLSDGDVIRVGSVLLLFTAVRQSAAAVPEKAAAIATALALVFFGMIADVRPAQAGEAASVQITQFDLGAFPLVKAYVSVLDGTGKPVRGLTSDGMSLRENGTVVRISSMQMAGTNGIREPLSIAIVLDRSESMTGEKIDRARESVLHFLSLMGPGDRAALIVFSDKVDTLEQLTGSQDILRKAVLTIHPSGNTALYDGIIRGVESIRSASGRKAVIVLSDGIANRGALDIDQAIESASRAGVSITVIGLGKNVRKSRLERIAQETGGSYFFTPQADGLSEIYLTISNRIRNEYAVTYQTTKRAEYLRNVSLSLGTGLSALRAYFQPASSLFGAAARPPAWAAVIPLLSFAGFLAISFRKLEQRQYQTGHLSIVRGKATKKDVALSSNMTIGRDERNTLGLFRDNNVEQRHAEVIQENGRYVIEDKGAKSGTFVNKKKVTGRLQLEDGDVINVGQATIVFSEGVKKTCADCGRTLRTASKFCPKCGAKA